jgi:CheY-like chemotaxis protein
VKPIARAWLLRQLRHRAIGGRPRRRILVIDDDEIVRYLVRQNFTQHEVVEAVDGEEGLIQARRVVPDVILLDLEMPGVGGSDVLERLAEDTVTREIPVVVLTAAPLDEVGRMRMTDRAVAVVSKAALAPGGQDSTLTETLERLGLA